MSCLPQSCTRHSPICTTWNLESWKTFLLGSCCSWLTRVSRCTVQRCTPRSETTLRRRQTRRDNIACSSSSPGTLGSSPSGSWCSWLIRASRCTVQRRTSRSETILPLPQIRRGHIACIWSSPKTFGPTLADSLNTLWRLHLDHNCLGDMANRMAC